MSIRTSIKKQISNRDTGSIKVALLLPLAFLLCSMTVQAAESCSSLYENKEFKSALKKCSFEAKHNSLTADYILGQLYINGLGVQKDIGKALSHYRKAVLNNDVDSQIALGKYHAENKNHLQSHIFFSLAIDSGSLSVLGEKESAARSLSYEDLELSKEYQNMVKTAIAQQRKQLAGHL